MTAARELVQMVQSKLEPHLSSRAAETPRQYLEKPRVVAGVRAAVPSSLRPRPTWRASHVAGLYSASGVSPALSRFGPRR